MLEQHFGMVRTRHDDVELRICRRHVCATVVRPGPRVIGVAQAAPHRPGRPERRVALDSAVQHGDGIIARPAFREEPRQTELGVRRQWESGLPVDPGHGRWRDGRRLDHAPIRGFGGGGVAALELDLGDMKPGRAVGRRRRGDPQERVERRGVIAALLEQQAAMVGPAPVGRVEHRRQRVRLQGRRAERGAVKRDPEVADRSGRPGIGAGAGVSRDQIVADRLRDSGEVRQRRQPGRLRTSRHRAARQPSRGGESDDAGKDDPGPARTDRHHRRRRTACAALAHRAVVAPQRLVQSVTRDMRS
jgi:hypothetical protein